MTSEVTDDFCGDLTVRSDLDLRISLLVNAHGPNGLANGRTLTNRFSYLDRDQRVVDSGDGTLTIRIKSTGDTWFGPDGKRLFSNNGQTHFEILVDHGGTPIYPSDDVEIEFLGVVEGSTGTNDTEGRDFCDDVHEFIG